MGSGNAGRDAPSWSIRPSPYIELSIGCIDRLVPPPLYVPPHNV
jgi:hypothetical protein